MNNIPDSVKEELFNVKKEMGDGFRRIHLDKNVFRSVIHAFEREEENGEFLRILLVGTSFIVVHDHDREEILEKLILLEGAYGHLFHPKFHLTKLEDVTCPRSFSKGETWGFSVMNVAYAILVIRILK